MAQEDQQHNRTIEGTIDSFKGDSLSPKKETSSMEISVVNNETKKMSNIEKVVTLIQNPFTKKLELDNSSSIKRLINKGIIDEKGTLLITQEQLSVLKSTEEGKKLVTQNRMFEAVTNFVRNLSYKEKALLHERIEKELISKDNEKEFFGMIKQLTVDKDLIDRVSELRQFKEVDKLLEKAREESRK